MEGQNVNSHRQILKVESHPRSFPFTAATAFVDRWRVVNRRKYTANAAQRVDVKRRLSRSQALVNIQTVRFLEPILGCYIDDFCPSRRTRDERTVARALTGSSAVVDDGVSDKRRAAFCS